MVLSETQGAICFERLTLILKIHERRACAAHRGMAHNARDLRCRLELSYSPRGGQNAGFGKWWSASSTSTACLDTAFIDAGLLDHRQQAQTTALAAAAFAEIATQGLP